MGASTDDATLLHLWARQRSADAWAELVRRHGALVYAAALRQVGNDAHLAEDVTQVVFILLARKARTIRLAAGGSACGWLYSATRFAARNAVRAERRRAWHERQSAAHRPEAITMQTENDPWADIAPLLDPAMATLRERDRQLVLLRYFQNHSLIEASAALGIRPNTAAKRLQRAIERLRAEFAARGVAVPTVALAAALSSHASSPIAPPLGAAFGGAHIPVHIKLLAVRTARTLAWSSLKFAASLFVAASMVASLATIGLVEACSAPAAPMSRPSQPTTPPTTSSDQRRLRPGDLIECTIADLQAPNVDTYRRMRVAPDGTINLPYIARLMAKGRTTDELTEDIGDAYKEQGFLNNANVTVNLVEPQTQPAPNHPAAPQSP